MDPPHTHKKKVMFWLFEWQLGMLAKKKLIFCLLETIENCQPPPPYVSKTQKMSFFVFAFFHKMPKKKRLIFWLLETTSILPPPLSPGDKIWAFFLQAFLSTVEVFLSLHGASVKLKVNCFFLNVKYSILRYYNQFYKTNSNNWFYPIISLIWCILDKNHGSSRMFFFLQNVWLF